MTYNAMYKNGKIERFAIMIDCPEEFEILRPYYILTSYDKPRIGNILEMNVLFGGSVWEGCQKHGYGYASSADVYETLISCIIKIHKNNLDDGIINELNSINTHNSHISFNPNTLAILKKLNDIRMYNKI